MAAATNVGHVPVVTTELRALQACRLSVVRIRVESLYCVHIRVVLNSTVAWYSEVTPILCDHDAIIYLVLILLSSHF